MFKAKPGLIWRPTLIRKIALENPSWGCDRIAEYLNTFAVPISSPTVQKILIDIKLGKVEERTLELERLVRAAEVDSAAVRVTDSQKEFILMNEQCKRPENVAGTRPGEILIQDRCWTGPRFPDYRYGANVIIDTFDGRIFCRLNQESAQQSAIESIDEVITALRREGIQVKTVLTDRGREFCAGDDLSSYSDFLACHRVRHDLFGMKGHNPKRPQIIVDAWALIVDDFLVPNHHRVIEQSVSLENLDYELSEWLVERYKSRIVVPDTAKAL